jgi:hypothetical protein
MVRFRGVSITTVGAGLLLLTLAAPEVGAQRTGVLRPAPRTQFGYGAGRPRAATIAPHLFTTCFATPFGFSPFFGFPFFGGFPFVNIQVFTGGNQPSPDPASHVMPNSNGKPVPVTGSYPVPGVQPVPGPQPVPGLQSVPGAVTTSANAVPTFAAPVYSAPVYSAPAFGSATPVAVPQVSNGMVVGDVIEDPSFLLWGSGIFVGGGITCFPTRFLDGGLLVR